MLDDFKLGLQQVYLTVLEDVVCLISAVNCDDHSRHSFAVVNGDLIGLLPPA